MNYFKSLVPYIILILFSLFLIWVYFYGLKTGQFIFSGDQFLRFSYYESYANSFFLRKMDNFGVFNSWQQIVQLWDLAYYLFVFKIGLTLIQVEKISFFISLFLSFVLSYIGLQKLALLFKVKQESFVLVGITLWYCVNPYTLVMWHGGIYNIGFAITYSLAPLILYFFDLAVFSSTSIKNKIICAILMFLSSFVFWLFAVFVFFLINYYLLSVFIRKQIFKNSLKHLFILILIFIPLSSVVVFTILHEFLNNTNDVNSAFFPTFSSQQGGMWYSMLMLFSWGIYTVWTPRVLFPFGDYFLSPAYKTVTLAIYFIILVGGFASFIEQQKKEIKILNNLYSFVRDKRNNFLFLFILLLIISIFFAKGSQPPFGEVFLFFYNYVPFFSVFRSADHRFGFAIIISVSVLLILVSNKYKRYFFFFILLIISIAQSYPMFFGSAVRGENIDDLYYDRIINITPEYKEVSDYINNNSSSTGYVMTLPSVDYGVYKLDPDNKEHLVGQDLLPKLINKPFVSFSPTSGMDLNAYKELYKSIESKDFQKLRMFPIEYIIFRKDVTCDDCPMLYENDLDKTFVKLIQNKLFTVYKISDFKPIVNINDQNEKVTFEMISPVMFKVKLNNIQDQDRLNFLLSFNKNWNIYMGGEDQGNILFRQNLFEKTHKITNNYANSWLVDTTYIRENFKDNFSSNPDGTINFDVVIYYQSQNWYYFYGFVSLGLFVIYLILIKNSYFFDRFFILHS